MTRQSRIRTVEVLLLNCTQDNRDRPLHQLPLQVIPCGLEPQLTSLSRMRFTN